MKTVLITGASGGIGEVACRLFLKENWRVFGVDLVESKLSHQNFTFYPFNLSDGLEVNKLVDNLSEATSHLDCLVNNAAIQISKSFLTTTEKDWDNTISINLKLGFFLTQKLFKLLES